MFIIVSSPSLSPSQTDRPLVNTELVLGRPRLSRYVHLCAASTPLTIPFRPYEQEYAACLLHRIESVH